MPGKLLVSYKKKKKMAKKIPRKYEVKHRKTLAP